MEGDDASRSLAWGEEAEGDWVAGPGKEGAETGAEQAWLWLLLVVMPGGLDSCGGATRTGRLRLFVFSSGESGRRGDESDGRVDICR
jgi:hypothetical protein